MDEIPRNPSCNRSLHNCVRTLAFAKGGRLMHRALRRGQLPHNFDAWNTSSDHNQSSMHIIKHHVFKIRDVQQGRLAAPRDTLGSNLRQCQAQLHATSKNTDTSIFVSRVSKSRKWSLSCFQPQKLYCCRALRIFCAYGKDASSPVRPSMRCHSFVASSPKRSVPALALFR